MDPRPAKRHLPVRLWLTWLCGISGIVLAAYSTQGLAGWWYATHTPAKEAVKKISTVVTKSTDHPDETPIAKTAGYTVPADVPRSIVLPTIGAEGFVQQVGVDQHNAMAVPGNVHVAGWYVHSVRPGEVGLSIIDGHVQGYYEEGIFKRLGNLRPGDSVQIEFGNLSKKNFVVRHVDSYPTSEAAKHLFEPAAGIDRQLNLITCGGPFDRKSGEYTRRIIVVAALVT